MNPIIIAECCQNHNGNRDILKKMIHEAASNGADYVKIQSIQSNDLTNRSRFNLGENFEDGSVKTIKRPYKDEYERLKKLDLSIEDEIWFIEECISAGVSPLTTLFTLDSVKKAKDLGYEAVKIASYDCASFPLLKKIKKHWKKIFVSTGATFDHEIKKCSKILNKNDLYFLHCITIYPTPLEKLNMRRLSYLRKYTSKVGFSDHTNVKDTDLIASKIALAMGADVIERHFTILEESKTKDGPVSINPSQLKELKNFASQSRYERMQQIILEYPNWKETLGSAKRDLTHEEMLNRDYYRGRFASKVDGNPIYNWE